MAIWISLLVSMCRRHLVVTLPVHLVLAHLSLDRGKPPGVSISLHRLLRRTYFLLIPGFPDHHIFWVLRLNFPRVLVLLERLGGVA